MANFKHFDAHGTQGLEKVWAVMDDGTEIEVPTADMVTWLANQQAQEAALTIQVGALAKRVESLEKKVK